MFYHVVNHNYNNKWTLEKKKETRMVNQNPPITTSEFVSLKGTVTQPEICYVVKIVNIV